MRSSAWPSAGVASLAPFLALIGAIVVAPEVPELWWRLGCGIAFALVLAGGVVTPKLKRAGRWLSTLGLAGFVVAAGPYLIRSPASSLLALIAFIASTGSLWALGRLDNGRLSRRRARQLIDKQVQIAAAFFLVEWLVVLLVTEGEPEPGSLVGLALAAGLLVFVAFALVWLVSALRRRDARFKPLAVTASLALVGGAVFARSLVGAATALAPVALVSLLVPPYGGPKDRSAWWEPVSEHPARLLVMTFLGLSTVGTLMLLVPLCSSSGESIDLIDAAFTAVSAVCVTGLIVLDTPADFSFIGELVILVLIQLGGLGIMSLSAVTIAFLGRRGSLRHETAIAGFMGSENLRTLRSALSRIIVFTLGVEALGALVLTAGFVGGGEALLSGLWRGIFTAISAFCNAGFALQSDSLMSYQEAPLVLHTVAILIVLGGLSPAAVAALVMKASRRPISLEHKMALIATAALLLSGSLLVLALEWSETLAGLSFWDRLTNAWFQSVTARTAGFNSVDIAAVRPGTLTVLMLFMFIGGSPGGTAGGIKTTTAVVLFLAVVAAVRGRSSASAFYRRILHGTVYRAFSISAMGVLSVIFALFAIQLTQPIESGIALFEVVSALGTVGLSTGATPLLDGVGKVVIMLCMFAGRVGPLSFFLVLQGRRTRSDWQFVEEDVSVG